ncbi:hypothetical protein PAI11_37310 [Patulibacter medicamentivorans]|uniref:SHOCT domain-containing protein n=1 Tax=Patulibacter medicamentivorans TaxID=1097667 RepID=H0EA57_9ACTN|nr:SHOCT domain-containing protein [Patulibacter medicamentivorans]EHN09397.1 hypothetical protein PAI11_37310 [Patulibacter medicamentivorans]
MRGTRQLMAATAGSPIAVGDRRWRPGAVRLAIRVAVVVVLAALAVAPRASAATEAQQGAQLLARVQDGRATCSSLTTDDFDRIGEYVMERMLGSAASHEAMNRQMRAMMGSAGEQRAHVYMGRRFAGCATGRAPAGLGAAIGMMGVGMMGASGDGSRGTMMGGSYGPGRMWGHRAGGDGWDGRGTAMAIFMGLLVLIAVVAVVLWRPWRPRSAATPLEILQQRFARGELDQEEFEQRRSLLDGTR